MPPLREVLPLIVELQKYSYLLEKELPLKKELFNTSLPGGFAINCRIAKILIPIGKRAPFEKRAL